MSDSDALMWSIEKDPVLRSTITLVSFLDRPPDRARLCERLERGTRLIPRLRQVPVRAPLAGGPPRWVTQAGVDLAYHLRWVKVPGNGTRRDVLDYAAPIAMQDFDRARPLWEFHVLEGMQDGGAAMIQKVHHSITDGVGGMQLAALLLDLDEHGADPGPMPEAPAPEALGPVDLVREVVSHEQRRVVGMARRALGRSISAARDPLGAARQATGVAASAARILAPAKAPLSPVMRERSLAVRFDTVVAPLDDMKLAAKRAGGKLNDAFVAAVAGGLRRYHLAHDAQVDRLRMTMPISVRDDTTKSTAGNQFVPARFTVPVGVADPLERMAAVRELVGAQRSEPAMGLTEPIAGVLNRLPRPVVTQLFGSMLKGVDFITSNVPGTPVPVYLAGARIVASFPFGPLTGAAVNTVLLSNVGELHVGVNTDRAAIPDGDVFLDCLRAGFDEVLSGS